MRSGPLRSRLGTGLRWAAAIPLVAVAACAPPPVDDDPAELTPRAVAAIALAHLPTDTVRRMAAPVGEVTPEGMVGADLRYADDQLVRVTVTPADSPGIDAAGLLTCDRPLLDNCADLGHDTTLRWQPDAEPGRYSLTRLVDGELLHAASIGPAVAEDPRLLEGVAVGGAAPPDPDGPGPAPHHDRRRRQRRGGARGLGRRAART